MDLDHDSAVFQALRLYRNGVLDQVREDLLRHLGNQADVDEAIRTLFKKEWEEIERSALVAKESGTIDRAPVDALDHLSVNHIPTLFEAYWPQICQLDDPKSEAARKLRGNLLTWAREITNVRNPVAHPPAAELGLADSLRYTDSAYRALMALGRDQASAVAAIWQALIDESTADAVAPPAVIDNLPSRETVTTLFVGRETQVADLWRWIGDSRHRTWALIGDGGKGKTTIAYEFTTQLLPVLPDFGLQGAIWMSAKQRRFLDGETVLTEHADFSTLDGALDVILSVMGWGAEKDLDLAAKQDQVMTLLAEFPMLIIADDVDSLGTENEDATEFLTRAVPATKSRVLLTSRQRLFGLGSSMTEVSGLTLDEVDEFVKSRGLDVGLSIDAFTPKVVRRIARITDSSPLYIEDLLRLAKFFSVEAAMEMWSGHRGDAAREYAMKRELELLSPEAHFLLGVFAYADGPMSLQESRAITGEDESCAIASMEELRRWNLLSAPALVEDVPRYAASRNLSRLVRRILKGSDEEQRIRNGLSGLKGVAVSKKKSAAFIRQAVALQRAGEYPEAERTLLAGDNEVPNSPDVHAMLAWLYSRWEPDPRYADSERHFERAEALGHRNPDMYRHWADLALKAREFGRAIEVCDRAIGGVGTAQGPNAEDPFIWRMKGLALTKRARLQHESLRIELADKSMREADIALRRSQALSESRGDLSKVFMARYELARTRRIDRETRDVLKEWKQRLPNDPYRPPS